MKWLRGCLSNKPQFEFLEWQYKGSTIRSAWNNFSCKTSIPPKQKKKVNNRKLFASTRGILVPVNVKINCKNMKITLITQWSTPSNLSAAKYELPEYSELTVTWTTSGNSDVMPPNVRATCGDNSHIEDIRHIKATATHETMCSSSGQIALLYLYKSYSVKLPYGSYLNLSC